MFLSPAIMKIDDCEYMFRMMQVTVVDANEKDMLLAADNMLRESERWEGA